MDLEDFLKKGLYKKHVHGSHDHHPQRHHEHHEYDSRYYGHDDHGKDCHDRHYYKGHYHGHHKMKILLSVLQSLPHKKALLAGAMAIGIIVLIAGILLVWALFPFLTSGLEYVEVKGIKGVLDNLIPYAERLWRGSGG